MRYERRPRLEISDRLIVDGDGAGTFRKRPGISVKGRGIAGCRAIGLNALSVRSDIGVAKVLSDGPGVIDFVFELVTDRCLVALVASRSQVRLGMHWGQFRIHAGIECAVRGKRRRSAAAGKGRCADSYRKPSVMFPHPP